MNTIANVEHIDAETLANRLKVSVRFIKDYSRATTTNDPIPHFRISRRTRLYAWGSAELENWLQRRGVGQTRRKA